MINLITDVGLCLKSKVGVFISSKALSTDYSAQLQVLQKKLPHKPPLCDDQTTVLAKLCEERLPLSSPHGAFGERVAIVVLLIFLLESITAELIVTHCDVAARASAPTERVQRALRAVNTHSFIRGHADNNNKTPTTTTKHRGI